METEWKESIGSPAVKLYMKEIGENQFDVILITEYKKKYVVQEVPVDLDEFSEEELELMPITETLSEFKKEYPNDWRKVLAEIVAFGVPLEFDQIFNEKEELSKFLKNKYNIGA